MGLFSFIVCILPGPVPNPPRNGMGTGLASYPLEFNNGCTVWNLFQLQHQHIKERDSLGRR